MADVPQLTEPEFFVAAAKSLQRYWAIETDEAKRLMRDYVEGTEFGDPDYDWSRYAAYELAKNYAEEFGERP